jgi:hypothetical protein
MASNIAVKVTADIIDLQTKFAVARAESSQLTGELNKLARQAAQTGGNISSGLQGQLTQAATAALGAQQRTSSLRQELAAFGAETGHGGISTATREFRALFDELSSGRTRMVPGTLAIIGQRVLGLGPAMLGAVGGVAALTAAFAYLVIQANRANEALHSAMAGADLANNLVSEDGIKKAEARLESFPGVSRTVAAQTIAVFASMRGMSNQIMLSLADNIQHLAEETNKSIPEAAEKLREFIEAPAKDGAKFIDMIGASADQSNRFTEAMKQGNAAALSVGLEIFAQRMHSGTTAAEDFTKRIDAARTSTYLLLESGDEMGGTFGAGVTGSLQVAGEAAQKFKQSVTSADSGDLAGAIKSAAAAAASLPPSLDVIRDKMEQIGEQSGKTRVEILNDQAAYLQSQMKVAQGAASSAEVQGEIEKMLSQKKVELAQATTTQITQNTRKEKQEQLNAVAEEVAATQQGTKERLAALQQEYDLAVSLFGKESNQAKAAATEMYATKRALAQQYIGTLVAVSQEAIDKDNETAKEGFANAKSLYSTKEISAQQELDLLNQTEATRYGLVKAELEKELQLWNGYPEQLKAIQKKIETDETEHQKNMSDIAREGAANQAREYAASWAGINRTVLSAEDQFAEGLLSGRQNLMQSIEQLALRTAEQEIAADLRYFTERALLQAEGISEDAAKEEGGVLVHAFAETQKTAATAAGVASRTASEQAGRAAGAAADAAAGSATILNDAYKAAAGAYAAVIQIPVVGPVLAPIAAGVAFAAVTAFDVMSAEHGQWNVGANGDLYQLHKEEMVLPANLARPMRSAVSAIAASGGNVGGNSTSKTLAPEMHIHGIDTSMKRHLAKLVADTWDDNPSLRPKKA